MAKRKRRKTKGGAAAAGKKTLKGKKALKRKRRVRKRAAAPAPVAERKPPYVAPRRVHIKEEVAKLLPHVDPRLIKKLDYWALYTIHQDVVKDGKDAEELARRLIKGYDPAKARGMAEAAAAKKTKEEERERRMKEAATRKAEARQKADAAKARARAARDRARAAARAAKDRARAARMRARAPKAAAPAPAPPPAAAGKAKAKAAAPKGAVTYPRASYVAPVRTAIRDELVKIIPGIKRSDLTGIDYWALYTMHSEIVKYGRAPESLARKFIKGYQKPKK
ncbi:MAG: hypothetical protein PHN82_00610 [bacterium]|nr:hypothetical protein [bacterium]